MNESTLSQRDVQLRRRNVRRALAGIVPAAALAATVLVGAAGPSGAQLPPLVGPTAILARAVTPSIGGCTVTVGNPYFNNEFDPQGRKLFRFPATASCKLVPRRVEVSQRHQYKDAAGNWQTKETKNWPVSRTEPNGPWSFDYEPTTAFSRLNAPATDLDIRSQVSFRICTIDAYPFCSADSRWIAGPAAHVYP